MKPPAEKAKELVDKFYIELKLHKGYYDEETSKQCALIAVDEILKGIVPKYDDERYAFELGGNQFYWQEVKNQIENHE